MRIEKLLITVAVPEDDYGCTTYDLITAVRDSLERDIDYCAFEVAEVKDGDIS